MNKEQAIEQKKERMKDLANRFANLSESERMEVLRKMGEIRTIEGHPLSLRNTFMLIYQKPSVTMVGGFQQWKKAGRIVRKGEKSLLILVPSAKKKEEGEKTEEGNPLFFFGGNVFDISQTDSLADAKEKAVASLFEPQSV